MTIELKVPPPLIGLLSAVLMWLLAHWLPEAHFPLPLAVLKALALTSLLLGSLSALLALYAFYRARTTLDPRHPERCRQLVTHGIYAWSRHPMYLSLVFLLCGFGLLLANWLSLLVLPLTATWLTHFQIMPEERILLAKFGYQYENYREDVARWL